MPVFSLYPPNTTSLSDNVICAVTQRSNSNRRHAAVAMIETPPEAMNAQAPSQACTKPCMANEATSTSKHQQNTRAQRERRRVNQARYRKKQRMLTLALESANSKLRQEVEELKLKRCNTHIGIPTTQTVWTVAMHYFRIFRFGLRSPPPLLRDFVLSFLQNAMAPDVTDGSICGVDALLENWSLFSVYFDNINIQLERLEIGGSVNLVMATTTTTVTISADTLRRVFPHLVANEEGNSLATKLQGRCISMRGSVLFTWDDKNDCVASMQSRSDMLTPLLQLLGNLEDVSRVFDSALVTPECRLTRREGN
uniref:BZIP domain-containing protein n=1 Tax=Phytophthora ramorum TaxID=164328 RepID=H3GNP8_PHYRM